MGENNVLRPTVGIFLLGIFTAWLRLHITGRQVLYPLSRRSKQGRYNQSPIFLKRAWRPSGQVVGPVTENVCTPLIWRAHTEPFHWARSSMSLMNGPRDLFWLLSAIADPTSVGEFWI